jgi:hypothetical protein
MKRGMTLSLYEWKELKKTIPLFEDKEPELRTMNNALVIYPFPAILFSYNIYIYVVLNNQYFFRKLSIYNDVS